MTGALLTILHKRHSRWELPGTYLGVWLQTRINTRWFYRLVYTLFLVTGIKLLYDGLTGL